MRGPYRREDGQPVMTDDRALLVFVASDEVVDTKQVLRADADFSCLDRSAVGELRADEVEIAAFRPRLGAAPVRFAAFAGAIPRQREDLRACFRRLWG